MDDHWLVRPATIRAIWRIFVAILVLTVAAGLVIDMDGHFEVERIVAFNALYGFLACVALIVGARWLAVLLKRPDTYYDDERRD